MISAALPYQKQRRRVLDREMAYVDVGQGDPIVSQIPNLFLDALSKKPIGLTNIAIRMKGINYDT